jgi:hypothetical protein
MYLARFRTYKLLHHPKQKPRRGGGLRQTNNCYKVALQVILFNDDILHCCLSVLAFHVALPKVQLFDWERFLLSEAPQIPLSAAS